MATNALTTFATPSLFADLVRPWNDWFQNDRELFRRNVPAVNVKETEQQYELSMAAPGLSKDDFRIDVDDNLLTIRSEKEENKSKKEERFTRQEYSYSSFTRSFSLPRDVQADAISATYKDGILQVSLPRRTASNNAGNGKQIPIK
ncbi:Hsp20/alpha crystallin family protein [Flaviaesturariibacter terrae]